MKIKLKKWTEENKKDLIRICNSVDRKYLSGRVPYPYTEESANWWYENVVSSDGKFPFVGVLHIKNNQDCGGSNDKNCNCEGC